MGHVRVPEPDVQRQRKSVRIVVASKGQRQSGEAASITRGLLSEHHQERCATAMGL